MRRTLGIVLVLLLSVSGVAIAQQAVTDDGPEIIPADAACAEVVGLHAQTWTCTKPFDQPTTTTTEPTTTTTEPTTTTTEPPTTTTTAPTTTTTTAPPGLVIPPTQPYPGRSSGIPFESGGSYTFILSNSATQTLWWEADYWAQNGLVTYPGMGGWVDGDRQGYVCEYGILLDVNGDTVGRALATVGNKSLNTSTQYAKVNDRYMAEAQRYLDGTIANSPGNELQDEECFDGAQDIDYGSACVGVTPATDERPRVAFFDSQGRVLDIRDYSNTDAASSIAFKLFSFDGTEAIVLACENELPAIVFYYTALGTGQLAVDFNGTGPFG